MLEEKQEQIDWPVAIEPAAERIGGSQTGRDNMMQRLMEFVQTMPGLGAIIDASGMVLDVFDNNNLLSGRLTAGQHVAALLPPSIAKKLLDIVQKALAHKMIQFDEYWLDTNCGCRIFDVRIVPLTYQQQDKAAVACHMTDVTAQNYAKKLLGQAKYLQRDLLNELIEDKITPSQSVLERAWQLKINLANSFSCYLLVLDQWQEQLADTLPRETIQPVLDAMLAFLYEQDHVIAWESKDGIVLLYQVDSNTLCGVEQEIDQAENLLQKLYLRMPDVICSVGIAEFYPNTFWQLAKVYKQACVAVQLGRKLTDANKIYHYCNIGVFQLCPAITDYDEIKAFIRRTLGRLLDYDRDKGTELVATLEKILQSDSIKTVAGQLYVHPHTVVLRKKRIEILLGISLNDFEARLAIAMALKFRQALLIK